MRSRLSLRERAREEAYYAQLAERGLRPIAPAADRQDSRYVTVTQDNSQVTVRRVANPKACCALCSRTARGFYYKHHPACSMECQDGIALIEEYMTTKPRMLAEMEKKAISDTIPTLFSSLTAIGKGQAFNDCTKPQMEWLINRLWDSVRESMQKQSDKGEIPF